MNPVNRKPVFGTILTTFQLNRLTRGLRVYYRKTIIILRYNIKAANNKGADQHADSVDGPADLRLCCSHRQNAGFLI